jgi:hypothetical protein
VIRKESFEDEEVPYVDHHTFVIRKESFEDEKIGWS